ncbi:galactoside alpha-(1,2)-fucosyltransferase 2-like [Ostrea edulis]|uniref:galactoside alpha-(1,2)-fucosyltransferase 2-like n=1 Tax=Ostrea edulis TaxID=37623 RepID=UPI00209478AA|nr:galactoside alpha-(1,2)-fucosyltransferase 2-like [Ostrea edulis]
MKIRLFLEVRRTATKYRTFVILLCCIVIWIWMKTPAKKNIVCVKFQGRLGNLMLEYGFLHAVSKLKSLSPVLPENFELLNVFNISDATPRYVQDRAAVCAELPIRIERWGLSYDGNLFSVPSGESVQFSGYYQSWRYWITIEDEIREMFQFKTSIRRKALSEFHRIMLFMEFDISQENNIVVSIHVRRGDYATEGHLKYGKITPNASYYINAMTYFRNKYRNVLFIVGSNDIEWSKTALGSESNVYFSTGLSAAEDMALLSLANHTIMSVGTYGWWIGWMARGTTVYYKNMFVPGSNFSKEFKDNSTVDFVYPGWTPMDETQDSWRRCIN